MKKVTFSEKQIKDILSKYNNEHLSLKRIGELYGVSRTVITRIMNENNQTIKADNHKYYADYNKFHNIDSAEKAYWLGFIAADGCNYEREKNASVIINIHRKDREHLEKFKAFMNSNVNIVDHIQDAGFSNNTPMSKITFNSKEMSHDLTALGVTPQKSLTLQPPKIKEEFYLPFILGYFDGDGSIFENQEIKTFGMNIEGTYELLTWINDILHISESLEKRYDDEKNNYYIRCGGTEKPYKILKELYDSCPTCLERKYLIYKKLEAVVLNRNIK